MLLLFPLINYFSNFYSLSLWAKMPLFWFPFSLLNFFFQFAIFLRLHSFFYIFLFSIFHGHTKVLSLTTGWAKNMKLSQVTCQTINGLEICPEYQLQHHKIPWTDSKESPNVFSRRSDVELFLWRAIWFQSWNTEETCSAKYLSHLYPLTVSINFFLND